MRNKRNKLFTSVLAYSLSAAVVTVINLSVANAQEDKLGQLDLDHDGKITIKEAVADPELLAVFGRIDTDGDGKLTRLELERAFYVMQKEMSAKS